MKIAIGKIIEAQPTLVMLSKTKMKAAASMKVARSLKKLETEFSTFNEQRNAFIEKHGLKDGPVPAEHLAEWQELVATEINVEIERIPLDDLEGALISPAEMMTVEWLIEEQELS